MRHWRLASVLAVALTVAGCVYGSPRRAWIEPGSQIALDRRQLAAVEFGVAEALRPPPPPVVLVPASGAVPAEPYPVVVSKRPVVIVPPPLRFGDYSAVRSLEGTITVCGFVFVPDARGRYSRTRYAGTMFPRTASGVFEVASPLTGIHVEHVRARCVEAGINL